MPAKALIVDDEPDLELLIRQRFRKKIKDGEYEFVFARNGLEALDRLKADPTLEIVLTDINMPVMDGLTLLSSLGDVNRPIKTVMVSAYGDMQNIRAAMNRGAYDFLTKPIDFQDFELTLSKAIQEQHVITEGLKGGEQVAEQKAEPESRSALLATASHEIRTPLNAIIGMADELSAMPLTPDQRKCIEVFKRDGTGLLSLINDILELSKVPADRAEFESIPFYLRDVIARAIELVEVRVAVKGLYLRQSIAPDVPLHLSGDPEQLRQILISLLTNSVKFTERGGLEIRVAVDPERPAPGRLRFAVVDTGIGIPAHEVDQLLETITQFDASATRKRETMGVGSTISRELVELMTGRVWVESQPGTGSTFFFTAEFGVAENPSGQAAELALPPPAGDFESLIAGMRILLVDSSEGNRLRILSYLRNTRCTIDVLEDSADAVALFDPGRYDVVLIDIEMQAKDGYAATGEIRRIEDAGGFVPTPVLAMTADARGGRVENAPVAGFTALLTKPIRRNALLEALARHASRLRRTNWRPKA